MKYRIILPVALATVALAAFTLVAGRSAACPFCSAVQQTLSEEIRGSDAAVIAKLVAGSAPAGEGTKAKFDIVKVLKGKDVLGEKKRIEVLFFGDPEPGKPFLIIGTEPKEIVWGTPTGMSERGAKYVAQLVDLPETGTDRMAFFQEYFEDADPLLAGDAYDEFAKAPYADVVKLKDQMHRDKLIGWIKSPDTSTSRRRLYLTLLGVCGKTEDLPELEAMIRAEDRQLRTALDALVACYLNLRGPDGLPLVEDLFLKNAKAEYTDTYATIMALRFHGQETNVISRPRLTAALRLMLDRPQLADLVIPDLARWEDWSVIDRLVELFKKADDDSIWVRVPVINYLRACPLPEAKQRIEELAKIDPDAVKRASNFFPSSGVATPPAGAQRPKDAEPAAEPAVEPTTPPALPKADDGKSRAEAPAEPASETSKASLPPAVAASLEKDAEIAPADDRPTSVAPIVPSDEDPEPIGTRAVLPVSAAVAAGLLVVMVVILRGEAPRG